MAQRCLDRTFYLFIDGLVLPWHVIGTPSCLCHWSRAHRKRSLLRFPNRTALMWTGSCSTTKKRITRPAPHLLSYGSNQTCCKIGLCHLGKQHSVRLFAAVISMAGGVRCGCIDQNSVQTNTSWTEDVKTHTALHRTTPHYTALHTARLGIPIPPLPPRIKTAKELESEMEGNANDGQGHAHGNAFFKCVIASSNTCVVSLVLI